MRSLFAIGWQDFVNDYFSDPKQADQLHIFQETFRIIETVLWVIMAIVGALGAIYAIYLGVQLARAEDQGKRDDAKKHLITVCIAIGVTIALIVVFNVAVPEIARAFIKKPDAAMLNPFLNVLRAIR